MSSPQGLGPSSRAAPVPTASATTTVDLDSDLHYNQPNTSPTLRTPHSYFTTLDYASGQMAAPPSSPSRNAVDRSNINIPARAATSPSYNSSDPDQDRHSPGSFGPLYRSEDLNHGSYDANFNPARAAPFARSSRPNTPSNHSNSAHSHSHQHEQLSHKMSSASIRSSNSPEGSQVASQVSENRVGAPSTSSTSSTLNLQNSPCATCGKLIQGAFVRALGTVYHLTCFKCIDCGDVVASKFFPIEGTEGKQSPLCERDYFRRLNLICASCGMALRGSYITACDKKYHVDHFTCSLCTTLFGPQDSYYEHDGDVYCHFHYSTRFATKCVGCNSAILKQFVEINRNSRDECWHPECYMINKFWNVKVVSRKSSFPALDANGQPIPPYKEEEDRETPTSLKEKQVRMEQLVYRIWTVLSAFEESSAACISDMLRMVSGTSYADAIRMAEKFILHVEVLFAAIDDLEWHFFRANMKGMSHVREARMLCRKTVDLFTLLSHSHENPSQRVGMTQELLALVTGLAHYLKILIRIALTGALKLEREQSAREAMTSFLDKLHLLAVQSGNPSARRIIKNAQGEPLQPSGGGNLGTQGVTYGFRSLAPENAGESPFVALPSTQEPVKISTTNPPSDLCVKCNTTVEEDCVRLGTYQRWHSSCVQCESCRRVAAVPSPKEATPKNIIPDSSESQSQAPKLSSVRRPPANVAQFVFDADSMVETTSFGLVPKVILCTDHGHEHCRAGFQAVSRLEQYAFLLNVALRRLYLLLKKQNLVPQSPAPAPSNAIAVGASHNEDGPYQSNDIMRTRTANLGRRLSSRAQMPKRSTIVESPAGKSVQPTGMVQAQKVQDGVSQPRSGQSSQQGQYIPTRTPPLPPQQPSSTNWNSRSNRLDSQSTHHLRPEFARNNTEVMIIDEPGPASPAGEVPHSILPTDDDSITLADIPQLMEAAQAREQHRPLPRQNDIPYIAELSALELTIVKHCAVLVLHKSSLRDQVDLEELLELVEAKKAGFFTKLFKGDNKKNMKKKGVFGVPLELLVEREGADSLLGATPATLRVPSFIDDVISAMRQMDMSVEGIFRKSGNIRRSKDLTEAIDKDPASVDLTQDTPVQLAALLKKFLRDLPDPLMTFKLQRLFLASQSLPSEYERRRMLHMISIILPKSHRDTMEVLFVFLKWVASFAHMDAETGSKMDLGNLATVICPSILYARGRDVARDESFTAIRVVQSLLEHQDEFFAVPEEFMGILAGQDYFSNSMELTSKEFMKKCDTYMKLKTSGRPSPMSVPSQSGSAYSPPTSRQPSAGPHGIDRSAPLSSTEGHMQYHRGNRQHSPPGDHTAMAYPQPSSSLSQSAAMLQQGQGRSGPSIWPRQNGTSSPRPLSYVQPRPSGEYPRTHTNGHSQPPNR